MRRASKLVRGGSVALAVSLLATLAFAAPIDRSVPITCTRGPSGQVYRVIVTMPFSQPVGSTFTIRIDGTLTGPISHGGLRYIHNMAADYTVPAGTTYVEGSAHIVAGTGSENVRGTARVSHDASGIHMLLPGHVDNGGSYTAPSIELQVKVDGPPGTMASLGFMGSDVDASVIILGDLHTACAPGPRPTVLSSTFIEKPTP